jgi:hypothetical protein
MIIATPRQLIQSQQSSSPGTAPKLQVEVTMERKVGVNISNTALISALHSSTTPHSQDEVLEVSPEKDDSRQSQS